MEVNKDPLTFWSVSVYFMCYTSILGHKVDVVDSFVYLGSSVDAMGETIMIFVEELSWPVHA